MASRVKNSNFDPTDGFKRGKASYVLILWQFCRLLFFESSFPLPSRLRVNVLRLFGAKIGRNVYLKPNVKIHFPWKLTIGDDTWVGEEALILNLEPIYIGNNVCISQRSFLCSGNHDYRSPNMRYRNQAIKVEDGAWIGAQSFIAPGLVVGADSVICAGSILLTSSAEGGIYAGNPAQFRGQRWK